MTWSKCCHSKKDKLGMERKSMTQARPKPNRKHAKFYKSLSGSVLRHTFNLCTALFLDPWYGLSLGTTNFSGLKLSSAYGPCSRHL